MALEDLRVEGLSSRTTTLPFCVLGPTVRARCAMHLTTTRSRVPIRCQPKSRQIIRLPLPGTEPIIRAIVLWQSSKLSRQAAFWLQLIT